MLPKSTELSLNLLINTIASVHFQNDLCIAYYKPFFQTNDIKVWPLSQSFPVVLNDLQCQHGCRQYILENPFIFIMTYFNPFKTCMVRQRNADMKAIVVLLYKTSMEQYSIFHGDLGIHEVVIIQYPDSFNIYGFANLDKTKHVLLNRWNIVGHRFTNEPGTVGIEAFFDDRWKHCPNASINLDISEYYPFKFLKIKEVGYSLKSAEAYILYYFTIYLNIQFKFSFSKETVVEAGLEKNAFYLAHRSSSQVYFPQTYPTIFFSIVYAVPKPK